MSIKGKEAFQDQKQTQIDLSSQRIAELAARVDQMSEEWKGVYRRQIDALSTKVEQLRAGLHRLQLASDATWNDVKTSVDNAWNDLRTSLNGMSTQLR